MRLSKPVRIESPTISSRPPGTTLPALPARVWWLLLPLVVLVFAGHALWQLPAALALYRY